MAVGADTRLLPEESTAEAISTGTEALLGCAGTASAARRIAAEIEAMPSPQEIAERLPECADR